ncbi:MAG: hypothetical protein RIC89_19380, partial [Pseudomonadales bacterium]
MEVSDWAFAKSALGECLTPVEAQGLNWLPASVPGTVAAELLRGQSIRYDSVLSLDDDDFWYRGKLDLQTDATDVVKLHLEGLATFAEIWLEDELLLRTENMFFAHELDVSRYFRT